jgi:hypothetical protein
MTVGTGKGRLARRANVRFMPGWLVTSLILSIGLTALVNLILRIL